MTSDTTVVALRQPDAVEDPLTTVLRSGARRLLAQAVETEAEAFLVEMRGLRLPDGRERLVQTGIGPVPVQRVKLRDRGIGPEGERIRFTSAVLPIFPASHRRLLHLRRASSALAILEVA